MDSADFFFLFQDPLTERTASRSKKSTVHLSVHC